jgi:hypothetical protein
MSENPGTEVATTGSSTVLTQEGEEFKTSGQTRLATRRGYRFAPSDKTLPVITSSGVTVNATQAKKIIEEADNDTEGLVYEVTDKED